MTRVVTIFLFAFIVSVNTPAGEIFKIPQLIEHYLKHHKENGSSLAEFLAIHYGAENKDADYPEDEQLPFRNTLVYNFSQGIVSPFIQPVPLVIMNGIERAHAINSSIPHSEPVNIFHPPRA